MKNNKWKFLFSVVCLLVIVSLVLYGNKLVVKSEDGNNSKEAVEVDYSHIDRVVKDTLLEEPTIAKEIQNIENKKAFSIRNNTSSVASLLNDEKTKFRLSIENKLLHKKISEKVLLTRAKEQNQSYLKALEIAEKYYGVTVSEDEITNYIKETILPVKLENKQNYADALGIKTEQLDLIFDRDIYLMDTLWEKLTPVLMERYPQKNGEDQNAYSERIKSIFYNENKKTRTNS